MARSPESFFLHGFRLVSATVRSDMVHILLEDQEDNPFYDNQDILDCILYALDVQPEMARLNNPYSSQNVQHTTLQTDNHIQEARV